MERTVDLSFLTTVTKPTRYTGGEVNEVVKNDGPEMFHVAIAFPDAYEIAMSTMGMKILYKILNEQPWLWAERVFMVMPDMEEAMAARGLPLYGLESKRPLCDFDVVGFSLQFELDYANILHMLNMGRIPLRAALRGPDHPVVVAGGPCACNPEPVAPFMDAILVGDGEEGFLELCEVARTMKGKSRRELWRELAKVEGAYVPAMYETAVDPETAMEMVTAPLEKGVPFPVKKRLLKDMDRFPFPTDVIVPHHEVVHDRYSVEIARGCSAGCRFCQAGYVYRPERRRSPSSILESVEEGLEKTGFNEVTLLSLNAGEYEGVERLIETIADEGEDRRVSVAMPSLRVNSLTRRLVEALSSGRKTSFTIAPEAGSQRLRDIVNKKITEEDVCNASTVLFSAGVKLVKLYFMMGLPLETDEDVEAIVRLAGLVVKTAKEAGASHPRATVSVSSFVPKPFTPFQWHPMAPAAVLREKQSYLKKMLRGPIAFKWHDVDATVVEGVFSLGDRRLSKVLEEAVSLGCRLDAWSEHFKRDAWREAFERCGVAPGDYIYRQRRENEPLPWDIIDVGVHKKFLRNEWQRALKGETTKTCGPADCLGCGSFAKACVAGAYARPLPDASIRRTSPANSRSFATFRLRYRKEGLARFLGHLDFVETLVRALRRVGVLLAYSKGYHPMPKVVFPAPLPLGVEGREEWGEFVGIVGDRRLLLEKLKGNLPSGIVPEMLTVVPPGAPSLSELTVQLYHVGIEGLDSGERTGFLERVSALNAAAEWMVTRTGKKTRRYDIKERVLSLSMDEGGLTVRLRRGGFMSLVKVLCPGPESSRLSLARLGLEFESVRESPQSRDG